MFLLFLYLSRVKRRLRPPSRRYRKFVKSVFDRLTAELHRQRVVTGLIHRIADRKCPVVSRHDLDVFRITETTDARTHAFANAHTRTHTTCENSSSDTILVILWSSNLLTLA